MEKKRGQLSFSKICDYIIQFYNSLKDLFHKTKNKKDKNFAYHIGRLSLLYQGGDKLFYFWHGPKEKSGNLRLSVLGFLLFFLLIAVGSLWLWPDPKAEWELTPGLQIGGYGEKNSLKPGQTFFAERDEELKSLLLGLKTEKKGKLGKDKATTSVKKIDYRVKPGDTLSKIAKEHNVSVEAIVGVSKITNPDRLQVGQTLQIPSRDGFFYQVKKGDKLAQILERHKVAWEKFLSENPDIHPDLLNVGDSIFLPGAKPLRAFSSWVVPVASRIITSGYGWRTWPQEAFHRGIDLKAYYTKVRAARSGIVTYAGWLGGYGKVVVIAHDAGYKTLYAHLSRIYVKEGQQVSGGQTIGISGNTGYSFGPHLHFEIVKDGENINPTKVLSGLIRRRK